MPNLKNKKVIKDQQGQRKYPGLVTEIQGDTMATTGYGDIPLYVVPNVGNPMVVPANSGNRVFPGASSFTEFPIAKNGGWLEKYQDGGIKIQQDNTYVNKNIDENLINSFINNNNINNSNNSNIDITKLTKPQQIDYGIKKVLEKEDPKSRKNLETLLKTTSYMENNYGSNKNAYNRKYTNSFMSVDDIAVKDIFTGKGDNNVFTKGQLNQLKRLNELNLPSDQVEFTKLLKKDNPTAAIAAARIVYANSPEALPDSNDPKKVFEYYYKYYNKAGASKYGNKDKDYKRFLEGYNKYSPQNKQDNSQWLDKY